MYYVFWLKLGFGPQMGRCLYFCNSMHGTDIVFQVGVFFVFFKSMFCKPPLVFSEHAKIDFAKTNSKIAQTQQFKIQLNRVITPTITSYKIAKILVFSRL